jgi:antitoxin component YwqK of YwqJK toxin-antitoxin module
MKRIIICILLSIHFIANAQNNSNIKYYYFDENIKITTQQNAVLVGEATIVNNHLVVQCYYKNTKDLYFIAHFLDTTLATLNGTFTYYYKNQIKQEEGNYAKDIKNGLWKTWDKKGYITDSSFYVNNVVVKQVKFGYNDNYTCQNSYSFYDSLQDIFNLKDYDSLCKLIHEVVFEKGKGVSKHYFKDSTFTQDIDNIVVRESEFKGGNQAWGVFLQENLNNNVPANNGAPSGKYIVEVSFTVDKYGKVTNIEATLLGASNFDKDYGTIDEAIRVIKKSPKWMPSIQYGILVKSRKKQRITFQVN